VAAKGYGWVYTCNNTSNSCVIPDPPYRKSDTAAGASLKIGIDPTGGTDPNSAAIKWSAPTAPYDQWAEMTTSATAEGDTVTVFLYMTQSAAMALNHVYWDQISLVKTTVIPDATPTAAEVPFVVAQNVRPDGSIIHIVQPGDTLSSIAYAYRDYSVTTESIARLNNLQPNQRFIQLNQELVILPPGSVDPATGQLLPAGSVLSSPTPATQGTATTPTAAPANTTTSEEDDIATKPATPTPVGTSAPQAAAVQPGTTPAEEEPEATEEAAAPEITPTAQEVAQVETGNTSGVNATSGTLCVTVYLDANTNLTHEADESLLAGANVVLSQSGSADASYPYEDTSGPLCLDLTPGRYQVHVSLPPGYGMTTADTANVSLVSGRQVSVAFGGAQGYTPPAAPAAEGQNSEQIESGAVAPMVEVVVDDKAEEKSALDRLYDNSGLIVLGFAGVIVISSTILVLALRRASR